MWNLKKGRSAGHICIDAKIYMRVVSLVFLLLFYCQISQSQIVDLSKDCNALQFFNSGAYGNKAHDTLFYDNRFGENHIYRVINNDSVIQFYISGNILSKSRVKVLECEDAIDTNGVEFSYCLKKLNGKTELFYDASPQVKYADMWFDEGVNSRNIFYSINGVKIKSESFKDNYSFIELMDSTGKLAYAIEYAVISNEKVILSEIVYLDGKKVLKESSSFRRFIVKNYQLITYIILILIGIKLLMGVSIFNLYYSQSEFDHLNKAERRLLVNFKTSFWVYIRNFNEEYWLMFIIHNISSLLLIATMVVLIYSLKN